MMGAKIPEPIVDNPHSCQERPGASLGMRNWQGSCQRLSERPIRFAPLTVGDYGGLIAELADVEVIRVIRRERVGSLQNPARSPNQANELPC